MSKSFIFRYFLNFGKLQLNFSLKKEAWRKFKSCFYFCRNSAGDILFVQSNRHIDERKAIVTEQQQAASYDSESHGVLVQPRI